MIADDPELLRRYVEMRDDTAFTELVRRYLNLVYFAALRQVGGDAHRAEDVAQVVFTLLARKASALTRHQTLAGWLHTTTRFTASEAMRAERRRLAREAEAHTMDELLNGSASDHEWERLRPVIDEALNDLGAPDREAVLLRFFANLPFAEVGAKLNLSENAARMRVERALDKLHALLVKRGVTSPSSALAVVLANQAAAMAPAGLVASVTSAALASADLTAATTLGFLQFMGTTKFVVGAAAIIGLLALGTAGHKIRAQRNAEASLIAANQDYAALVARLRGLEQRAHAAEQRAAETKQIVAAAEAKAAADAAAAKAAAAWNPAAEGKAFLQRHPEVKQAIIDLNNSFNVVRYGPLYRSLGLTPAQIGEFQTIIRAPTFSESATVDGKKLEMTFETRARFNSEAEYLDRLRAVVGDEGIVEYRKFLRDPAKTTALNGALRLANDLCLTDAPLTPQQAGQVIQILHAGLSGKFGPRIAGNPSVNTAEVEWAGIDGRAREILSAAQLPAWQSALAQTRKESSPKVASPLSPAPAK